MIDGFVVHRIPGPLGQAEKNTLINTRMKCQFYHKITQKLLL